jgi:hypothetical protein
MYEQTTTGRPSGGRAATQLAADDDPSHQI